MGAMVAGTPKAIVAGAIIGGKYRIERELARGGQGTVVLATHLALRQSVAIKFSNLEGDGRRERMKRLVHEARAACRLRGEHVVRVIDVDVDDGMPFIVMEYLQGTTLKDLMASRGPLPVGEAVDLVLQACEGVAEAHDLGIAHRDLKPSNLFLVDRPAAGPVLKVLDFGIAKTLTPLAPDGDLSLTAPLTLLGSPGYMSPEQARDPRQVDTRTDIWSLGLVLHELLTGRPVFDGRTRADILASVLLKDPTPISLLRPDVPLEIERVIQRCLQKLPEYRFSSVRDLAAHLLPFVSPAADTGSHHLVGSWSLPAPERDPAPQVTRTFSASVPPAASPSGSIGHSRWARGALWMLAAAAAVVAVPRLHRIGAKPLFARTPDRSAAAGTPEAKLASERPAPPPVVATRADTPARLELRQSLAGAEACALHSGSENPSRRDPPGPDTGGNRRARLGSRLHGGSAQVSRNRHGSASPSSRPTLTAAIDPALAGDDVTEDDPLNARK
jgi:serine/threonine protein kinase